jgi:hypothetical protein
MQLMHAIIEIPIAALRGTPLIDVSFKKDCLGRVYVTQYGKKTKPTPSLASLGSACLFCTVKGSIMPFCDYADILALTAKTVERIN